VLHNLIRLHMVSDAPRAPSADSFDKAHQYSQQPVDTVQVGFIAATSTTRLCAYLDLDSLSG